MAKRYKTGGRKKGTPNKLTSEVKAAIEAAFVAVGGSAYLKGIAKDKPEVFCSLLAKVLPHQVNHAAGEGASVTFVMHLHPEDGG